MVSGLINLAAPSPLHDLWHIDIQSFAENEIWKLGIAWDLSKSAWLCSQGILMKSKKIIATFVFRFVNDYLMCARRHER